jgi:hypothetical protein
MNRRRFLETGSVVLASSLLTHRVAGGTSRVDDPWYRRSPRVYLVDFQFPDPIDQAVPGMPRFLMNLDPERLVREVITAKANGILAHTKCHEGNAYYNTKVGHKHSGLGDRDLLAELSKLCRSHRLALLFYYSLSWEQRAFVGHPDWRGIDASGKEMIRPHGEPLHPNGNQKWTVCMNGGYRDYATAMLSELSRGYDFDGFWLDLPGTVCFCSKCQADFRTATGLETPRQSGSTENDRVYRRWRLKRNAEILRGFAEAIHAINPRLTVSSNGAPFDPEFAWDSVMSQDYLSREYHYPEGPAAVSLYARKFWAVKPGVPFELEIWRYAFPGRHGYSRGFQVRPSEALQTEMAGVVAHGGWPQYYDQVRMDGTLDPASLAAVGPAFAAVRERQPWSGRGEPVPYAAVVWSKATETWHADGRALFQQGLEGLHLAMIERRVPVGVLTEDALARQEWRGAKVVILPAVYCLSDVAIAALRAFVVAGGGLVVTDRSSLWDEEGRPRTNFGLADLIGADFQGLTRTWLTFLSVDGEHAIGKGVRGGFPITVNETLQALVRPRDGTKAMGAIHLPVPGFKMGSAPGPATEYPAFLTRELGRGRVVYASATLGAMYSRYSLPDVRQLILNAVTWAAGTPPPLSATAPETVEIVPWRDSATRRTILHLINRTGAGLAQNPGQMMHEVIPVHDLQIHLGPSLAGRKVVAQPGRRRVESRHHQGGMTINLPKLDIWEVLEISG